MPDIVQLVIAKLVSGNDLTRAEARKTLELLIDGPATDSQIAAVLVALHIKGETVEEVAGFADAMRSRVVQVNAHRRPILDTCGTGGSKFRVFNVSTAVSFVAASAGMAVAKHGNRAVTGVCGSADVLEELGVRVDLTPEQCARCIDEFGVGFLFAQRHHPAMKRVSAPRREIGVRSIFNLLGPLSNPAGATIQSMGVYDDALCSVAAGALKELGTQRAIVFHGEIGLDEISTIGPTHVCEFNDGSISEYELSPQLLGITDPEPDPLDLAPCKERASNAAYVRDVLSGRRDDAARISRYNLVAVNAAAALRVAGRVESWPEAVHAARELLDSGQALKILDRLATFTQELV